MSDQAVVRATLSRLAASPAAALDGLSDQDIIGASTSPATRRAYQSDARIFAAWCDQHGVPALPASAETVAAFLLADARGGARASTISRRVAAIRALHRHAGLETPTSAELVRTTMRGIRRSIGTAKVRKAAATADLVRLMLDSLPGTMAGTRDRALLSLGFSIAARRSELVALDVEDLEQVTDGLIVTIRRSKTDQEGAGARVHVPRGHRIRPVVAVRAWLELAGIGSGPLFRRIGRTGQLGARLSDAYVAQLVKACCVAIGEDPARFSGHSLRAGFLTSAASSGATLFKMMDVSRHRSVETLRGYVRDADGFRDHAGSGFL